MPSYSQYLRQMAVMDKDDDIEWITVKGNHIPIKKGENKEDAIKSFFESKSKGEKGNESGKKTSEPRKADNSHLQKSIETILKKSKLDFSKASEKPAAKTAKTETPKAPSKAIVHILDTAESSEPKITADLKSIPGIEFHGLDFRLKTRKSAIDKITRNRIEDPKKYENISDEQIMGDMWDLVRYTQVVKPETFKKQAIQTLKTLEKKGYKIHDIKNFYNPKVNKGTNPYRGINAKIISPDGQKFEYQFNTPKNIYIKDNGLHTVYEKQRNYAPDSKEFQEYNAVSMQISKLFDAPQDGLEDFTWERS